MNYDAVNKMIGQPWVYGSNDCYAVVKKAAKAIFGINIYDYEIPEQSNTYANIRIFREEAMDSRWRKIGDQKPGCIVLFKTWRNNPVHIGICLDGGLVLHCPGTTKNPGSTICEKLKEIRLRYKNIEFYEYNGS